MSAFLVVAGISIIYQIIVSILKIIFGTYARLTTD